MISIICLKYTKMKSERRVGTESAYSITFTENQWRQSVDECGGMCQIAYRCNVVAKAQKQKQTTAESGDSLTISADIGGRRQRRVQRSRLIGRITELIVSFPLTPKHTGGVRRIVLSFAPCAAAVWHCDRVRITCESNSVRHNVLFKRWAGQFVFEQKVSTKALEKTLLKSLVL